MEQIERYLTIQSLYCTVEGHSRFQLMSSTIDAMDCIAVLDAGAEGLIVRQRVRDNNMHLKASVPEKADNALAGDSQPTYCGGKLLGYKTDGCGVGLAMIHLLAFG